MEDAAQTNVLRSASELFGVIKKSLQRCSRFVSRGEPMLRLMGAFQASRSGPQEPSPESCQDALESRCPSSQDALSHGGPETASCAFGRQCSHLDCELYMFQPFMVCCSGCCAPTPPSSSPGCPRPPPGGPQAARARARRTGISSSTTRMWWWSAPSLLRLSTVMRLSVPLAATSPRPSIHPLVRR